MRHHLTGLSSTSTNDQIVTFDQLGGTGTVRNKALAIPSHLNNVGGFNPWQSIEYVSIDPICDGIRSSVGQHTQTTDELYYIVEGSGMLTVNGEPERVFPGYLALAPCGTTHSFVNDSLTEALSFLVVELWALSDDSKRPIILPVASTLQPSNNVPVHVGKSRVPCPLVEMELRPFFGHSSCWGKLSLIVFPPGARVTMDRERKADQLLLLSGFATVVVTKDLASESDTVPREEICIETSGIGYHSVLVPAGAMFRIENRASGNYPVTLLRVTVPR